MIYLEGRKLKLNVFKTAPKFDEIIVYNDSRKSDGGSQPATNKNRTNHLSTPVSERQGMKEDDEVPQDKKRSRRLNNKRKQERRAGKTKNHEDDLVEKKDRKKEMMVNKLMLLAVEIHK